MTAAKLLGSPMESLNSVIDIRALIRNKIFLITYP